jgi:hypothetical protein
VSLNASFSQVEALEASDVVTRAAQGKGLPAELSEADRARLEKTLREQDVLLQASVPATPLLPCPRSPALSLCTGLAGGAGCVVVKKRRNFVL